MTPEVAVIAAAAVTATGTVIAAAIGLLVVRAHRGTREELRENTDKTQLVLEQVANDHDSNLRHDLDQVQADLARYGGMLGRVVVKLDKVLDHNREHEAGAALAFEGLQQRDRQLDRRLRALERPADDPGEG